MPGLPARSRPRSTGSPGSDSPGPRSDWRAGGPGERTVPHAWLESLTSTDHAMPPSLPADKVAAFAAELSVWVASGAVSLGRAQLCLRVHEPGTHPGAAAEDPSRWWLELLLWDSLEPSLVVPIGELWAGRTPFPAGSVTEMLRSLARMAGVAPELSGVLDSPAPVGLGLSMEELLEFVDGRVEPLAEIGVHVLLPSWWAHRRRVSLRAHAKSAGPKGVVTEAGLGFDRLVTFTWEAALDDRKLTKADLRQLQHAADAKQQLVQLRGEWVRVDGVSLQRILARAGSAGKATAGDLVRSSLGSRSSTATPTAATGWHAGLVGDHVDDEPVVEVAAVVHRDPEQVSDRAAGAVAAHDERGVDVDLSAGPVGAGEGRTVAGLVQRGDLDPATDLDGVELAGAAFEHRFEGRLVEHRRLGPPRAAARPSLRNRRSRQYVLLVSAKARANGSVRDYGGGGLWLTVTETSRLRPLARARVKVSWSPISSGRASPVRRM